MALEERDPAALKCNVLHLVLQHPEGVKFGDFSAAFLQFHGFQPELALHGYRSLKELVTEMKNFVILEGDSQNPVIKVASNLDLYQWLEGGDEKGADDSEEELLSWLDEKAEAEEELEVLDLIVSLLITYKTGLTIEEVQEFLDFHKNGVDIEMFSIAQGYKDTLEFLEYRIPELKIKYHENRLKCVVHLTAEKMQPPCSSNPHAILDPMLPSSLLNLLSSLLSTYKTGLRIEKVQEFLLAKNGVDLEKFSITQGYKDTLEFLEDQMPELTVIYQENRLKCVVQLNAGAAGEVQPSISSSFSNKARTGKPHTILDPKLLTSLLNNYKTGLRIAKLQELLLAKNRVDLEKFCITQGYKDTLEFLECQMPELTIKYQGNRCKCVVRLKARKKKPPVSTSSCEQVRNCKLHKDLDPKLLTSLLSNYNEGLRIEKVQEFLLAKNRVDLEKFSIAQGYKDTLEFLERQMPEVTIRYREDRLKCVAQLKAGTTGEMKPPASSSSCTKVVQSGLTISSSCPPPLQNGSLASSKTAQNPEHSTEKNGTQNGTEPPSSIISQVKALLSTYKLGLKIGNVQEFLLAKNGVNIEMFSIAQGYKDTLEFLEHRMPELRIQYQKNRLKCVVQFTAGTAEEIQLPVSSCTKLLQEVPTISSSCPATPQDVPLDSSKTVQNPDPRTEKNRIQNGTEPPLGTNNAAPQLRVPMAREVGDSGTLKCNVLQLVLMNPKGVKFGDFSRAFQHVHNYPPQLSLHGYHSLRDLLFEMKDIVVVEDSSQDPVFKIARDSYLYQWLEGVEENGLDDSEGKAQRLSCGKTTGEDAEILGLLTSLLNAYQNGLRIEKVQEFLLAKNGVDLEKFSIAQGYKDTLEFLEHQIPELTIKYQENRLKCVVQLVVGTAGEMQPPVSSSSCEKGIHLCSQVLQTGLAISSSCPSPSENVSLDSEKNNTQNRTKSPPSTNHLVPQLQGQMAMQERDPDALKRNVLHLVLQHPEGVRFGNFSGAFQQLHGCCPQLTSHGYSSLRALVADMKDVVVLDIDSQDPLLKAARHLYQWLEGREENKWDDSERKAQILSYEQTAREDAGFSVAFVAIRDVLKNHPNGLKVKKLKEALGRQCDFDLERIRSHLGYKDIVSFLQNMPGLLVRKRNTVRNCVVQLQSGVSSPAPSLDTDFSASNSSTTFQEQVRKESGTHCLTPSLDTDFCAHNSHAIPEKAMTKKPDLASALVLILDVLGDYPLVLTLKALKENLEAKHGFDLDTFSQELGYEDAVVCLLEIPGLCITYQNGEQFQNCIIQLHSDAPVLPSWLLTDNHSLDKLSFSCGSNSFQQEDYGEKRPGSCISTLSQVSVPISLDSKETSIKSETSNRMKVEKKPGPAVLEEVLALVSRLLSSKGFKKGLKLKKVQKLLLTTKGVNLEEFSISQGYKDSLAFLECHMPKLKISYQENQLSCVLQLGSDSGVSSVPPLLDAPAPNIQAVNSVPGSCISTSSQFSAPLSLDSKDSSIKSASSNQRKAEKMPALEEVLVLLSNLLSSKGYASGLRLKKLQELLLTKEGVDLEKFSIAQGYKNSLAFLECCMPELEIFFQEDQLSCVIRLGPGPQAKTSPPLLNAPIPLMQTTKKVGTANSVPALVEVSTLLSSLLAPNQYPLGLKLNKVQELLLIKEGFDLEKFSIAQGHKDSLAFLECNLNTLAVFGCPLMIRYQNDRLNCVLQFYSGYVANSIRPLCDVPIPFQRAIKVEPANSLPVSPDHHGAFLGKDKCPSQPQSNVSAQLLNECQIRRSSPMEELPSLSNAQLLRRPNLTGPHHLKDLDELKKEVAHILARHPEGMSLFQFRVEYSAAYLKHLPLGNASSAKQFLLQMPDVVCLKGYGVQTVLFPVSSKESSLKSVQRIISRVEDTSVVPSHSSSKAVTVADPVVVFPPSHPKATVMPQPLTIHTSVHISESGKLEGSVLPHSEMSRAPKPRALLQEHEMARTNLGNPSGQSCLSNVADVAVAPGSSLSKTDPVVVPKSTAPKATMAPVPQPRSFPHLYSECFKPLNNNKDCPHPETSQRPTKAAAPEEEQVMRRARPRGTPLPPTSPVVFPLKLGEMSDGFALKPPRLPRPCASDPNTLTPSVSQHLPASYMPWAQPLVFPPTLFLSQPVPPPSLASVYNTSRLQPQHGKSQSTHLAQAVPQMTTAQPTSPLRSAEQRNYVYEAQGPGVFSQELRSSRTNIHAQSQAECPWLVGQQCRSMSSTSSSVDNSIMITSSTRAPNQSVSHRSHSLHRNIVTSPSTLPSSAMPAPTKVSQQPSYVSRHISTHSNALPSSDFGSSPQPFEPQNLISNRDSQQGFKYPQQYIGVHSTISSTATQSASSLTSPVYFPTNTSGQPSYTSYNSTTDYSVPNQTKSLQTASKNDTNQGNHYVTWTDKQKPHIVQRPTESYSSTFHNSPPKNPGKCVIL